MSKIEVIATNGIISKKIHFIAFNKNSILCAIVTGQNRHAIIHSDGSLHVKQDDVKNAEHLDQPKNRSFKPLSDFKNSFRVASYTFTNDIAKIPTPNYSKKKSMKSLICPIDVRNYPPNNQIVCDVNLVEPERYDLIEAIKPPDCKKFLYSHFVPWIVISVYAFDFN
jgi:hypothetical protein